MVILASKRKAEEDGNETHAKRQPKGKGIFKADGTPIKNPVAFVAGMQKRNEFHEELKGSDGKVIRDPVAYVAAMQQRGEAGGQSYAYVPSSSGKGHGKGYGAPMAQGRGIFKADGSQIRDPVAFVAGIEKWGYSEPILDASGNAIRDPVAYVAAMAMRGEAPVPKGGGKGRGAVPYAGGGAGVVPYAGGGAQQGGIFKMDGTPIRNPAAFVAGIEKNGYMEPICGADGVPIRNPASYVASMMARGGSAGGGGGGGGGGSWMHVGGGGGNKSGGIFKADGTQIRNPAAFVAGIEKNGYHDPIFDASGVKIKNPVNYVNSMRN